MDVASQNFITVLRGIRANLKEALLAADNFEHKLLGPRPEGQQGESPKPTECIASLLVEISRLSVALVKTTQRHHEIMGDFVGDQIAGSANPGNGPTRARFD